MSFRAFFLCCIFWLLVLVGQGVTEELQAGSIGVQVVPTSNGELVVLQIVPGSPAVAAGLAPGDLIVLVDGQPLLGSEFSTIVAERLWGEVGSSVRLTYLRPGVAGTRSVRLQRATLQGALKSLLGVKMLAPQAD